jgi:hypothetical protein
MVRNKGVRVSPWGITGIRQLTQNLREVFELKGGIHMIKFIEFVLPELWEDFHWEVREADEMNGDEARAYPDEGRMVIREDIYDEAWLLNSSSTRKFGCHNFTLAHEFAHLVMHRGCSALARSAHDNNPRSCVEDSEWQAETFAAEFLMPCKEVLGCTSIDQIEKTYLVSPEAAKITYEDVVKKSR